MIKLESFSVTDDISGINHEGAGILKPVVWAWHLGYLILWEVMAWKTS